MKWSHYFLSKLGVLLFILPLTQRMLGEKTYGRREIRKQAVKSQTEQLQMGSSPFLHSFQPHIYFKGHCDSRELGLYRKNIMNPEKNSVFIISRTKWFGLHDLLNFTASISLVSLVTG